MIEREFVAQKTKEYYIKKFIESKLSKVGLSSIKLKKIPMGEKIIIETSKPSLIVGPKGTNIKELTLTLKKEFKLENPQIEINEVKNIFLDPIIVADKIAGSLERFGSARFKGVGHKIMENVINSGALGIEIVLSGKIPSARAKSWRFYQGYLKKCGDIAMHGVRKAHTAALLKSGIVGIKVSIMPPDLELPDNVEILDEPRQVIEEIIEKGVAGAKVTKPKTAKKSSKKKETGELVKVEKEVVGEEPKAKKKEKKAVAVKTENEDQKLAVEAVEINEEATTELTEEPK
ncbi:MAG TPA: 30S ribosomal protein S3 [Candidatus Nanoarchaeia archaeon]|nr:30S ribosomal protein S3 [Candidatus Nanoarchaeia archaeon]